MKYYHIGFDLGDEFNGIATAVKLSAAKALAAEIEEEYGEKPVIRREDNARCCDT